jgi:hypothetical protein
MSDNIKKINLSTPGRILDAGDIRRKKDKLDKTLGQLENLQEGSKKYHRKMFKAEKTLGQLQSGRAGIQGFKMPYNMVKNNSAIKEVINEEVRRVPESLPPPRIVEPEEVDNTYAENLARNIAKHDRQNAMIEADRARELERQMLEREFFTKTSEPSFQSLPLKPMDPIVETSYSPKEVIRQKSIIENLPQLEVPEFKPLKGKEKREFKRENIQRVADKYGITRGQARRGLRKMRRAGEDYIPEEYLSSLQMVKRSSATPYKLPHQSKGALKQTVSSSGGDNRLDEFLKRVESRTITNPEYDDQKGPSKSYDFFITNRSPESDKVAIKMDSLNQVIREQAANRQFNEMNKSRAFQQNLMNKYNLD